MFLSCCEKLAALRKISFQISKVGQWRFAVRNALFFIGIHQQEYVTIPFAQSIFSIIILMRETAILIFYINNIIAFCSKAFSKSQNCLCNGPCSLARPCSLAPGFEFSKGKVILLDIYF